MILNTRVRDKGKKKDIFVKVNEIKQLIKDIIPEVEDDKMLIMLSHCRNFFYGKLHYGRRGKKNLHRVRELTANERLVYDLLMRHSLNPSTTYRWFIASRLPSDVKDKLRRGKISQLKALEIARNRKRAKESGLGLLMMEEIKTIMRGL